MAEKTLLQKMLRLLSSGGLHTMDEAARRLGISEGLVAAMVENLERRGYLVAVGGSCSTACGGCPVAGVCGAPAPASSPPQLLALTAKGRLAAEAA